MATLYLIVSIAGRRVAIAAEPVESVVEIDSVTPVPLVPPHIAGLAALRSRVLTIVDCLRSLELGTTACEGVIPTVIVTVEGHQYGLLVEEVVDVVSVRGDPQPVRVALGPGWRSAARTMIIHEGEALLLLDPAALIAGPRAIAA